MRIMTVALTSLLVAGPVAAQDQAVRAGQSAGSPKRSLAPKVEWTLRTPDGQPDLQGTWVNFDSTPFEAPVPVSGPGANAGVGPPDHWTSHNSPDSPRREAMVVDPPDGRVPVLPWAEARRDYDLEHLPDSWVHETPWVRCITRGVPGGMFPAAYNNGYRFVQTPGFVVIVYEMLHESRIIPLDGRPHVGRNIRLWNGDPRGHWDGNTLIVETTNYNDKGSIATSAATGRIRGLPQSEALHVTERFTRIDAKTINYEVTIDDPNVYGKPWKVALPLNRDPDYQIYEYACHEGNYAMGGILRGARAQEKP
jgi:hypothetical protein